MIPQEHLQECRPDGHWPTPQICQEDLQKHSQEHLQEPSQVHFRSICRSAAQMAIGQPTRFVQYMLLQENLPEYMHAHFQDHSQENL